MVNESPHSPFIIINSPFTIRKFSHTPTQHENLNATLNFTGLMHNSVITRVPSLPTIPNLT